MGEKLERARPKRKKTGGRKKGTPNKRTVFNKLPHRVRRRILPLEYMLNVMRSGRADKERRDEMARAAAPYVHPRLNAIQHTGKDGEPIAVTFTGVDKGAL